MTAPRFLDAGEAALVVEFGSAVDPALNDQVLRLDNALSRAAPKGLRELVPTYRSLMIHYDPLCLDRASLITLIQASLKADTGPARAARTWQFPCYYGGPYGDDLEALATLLGLSATRVADLHASARYRVYMYGFSPGFTYLGGLPAALTISRRVTPRPPPVDKTITVGGNQTAIATFPMPTGWYVIARTPVRLYAPERTVPFLVEAGDNIIFDPVDRDSFEALQMRAAAGDPIARRIDP